MKGLMIIILFGWGFMANAQNGTKFLSLKGGVAVREAYMGSLSIDFNRRYHNQHEIFTEWMQTAGTDYRTIMGGFSTKPVAVRGNNSTIRFRFGAGVGTDFNRFVAAPHAGWEFAQTFGNRMDITFGNKNQAVLWAPKEERWRFIFELGMRFPLN